MVNANTEFFFGLVILAYWGSWLFCGGNYGFGVWFEHPKVRNCFKFLITIVYWYHSLSGLWHWNTNFFDLLSLFYTTERFCMSYNLCIFFSIASLSVWKLFYSVLCLGVLYYKDNIFLFLFSQMWQICMAVQDLVVTFVFSHGCPLISIWMVK